MAAKVVDASVLAAFAFGEPRSGEAAILLARAELYSPELLTYELANVALRKSQHYPVQARQIAGALEAVLSLDISLVPPGGNRSARACSGAEAERPRRGISAARAAA